MAPSLGEEAALLSKELHATLCGLVDESRGRNQTLLTGIRGDDGIQVGRARARDLELDVLERWGLVRVVASDDMSRTVEIRQPALDLCPAGS